MPPFKPHLTGLAGFELNERCAGISFYCFLCKAIKKEIRFSQEEGFAFCLVNWTGVALHEKTLKVTHTMAVRSFVKHIKVLSLNCSDCSTRRIYKIARSLLRSAHTAGTGIWIMHFGIWSLDSARSPAGKRALPLKFWLVLAWKTPSSRALSSNWKRSSNCREVASVSLLALICALFIGSSRKFSTESSD